MDKKLVIMPCMDMIAGMVTAAAYLMPTMPCWRRQSRMEIPMRLWKNFWSAIWVLNPLASAMEPIGVSFLPRSVMIRAKRTSCMASSAVW